MILILNAPNVLEYNPWNVLGQSLNAPVLEYNPWNVLGQSLRAVLVWMHLC